jgi:glyoxylase-like metal-dependent hydrolase (beta-lactamase superfamily II)
MLTQVAQGVLVHESEFMQSNAVVVHGSTGVLVVDPGVTGDELADIANDLADSGQTVVAGFSTHPHWDHVLWDARLGSPPRHGTARGAAVVEALLSDPDWRAGVAGMIPPDIVEQVPLDDMFGRITGLPSETARIPWDGPGIRILEHHAHAPGHAALLIEERGVLIAGDMLSDILIPMLNLMTPNAIEDYLAALQLLESVADDVKVVVPGHGSVGGVDQFRERIDQDREYVQALRDAGASDDPRIGPWATFGKDWLPGVHERQLQCLAQGSERDRAQ